MSQVLQVAAIAVATLGTDATTMSVMSEDIADLHVPEGAWTSSRALDGRAFTIYGVDIDSGAVLEDELLFRDGTLQSVGCQNFCDFGWSDYQTKNIDGVIHFTATTICPDAPHTVVSYGQATGDTLTLEGIWTTQRWYWTNQIVMEASGTVTAFAAATAVSG